MNIRRQTRARHHGRLAKIYRITTVEKQLCEKLGVDIITYCKLLPKCRYRVERRFKGYK